MFQAIQSNNLNERKYIENALLVESFNSYFYLYNTKVCFLL